ncbi:MAG: hypothetical protein FJW95_05795 [Actinobacteria bacterium]|nr:hypothetical protein [Actinomycetota bacterium]
MPVGAGVPHLTATTADPASPRALADGYTEVEFLVRGVASTYSGPVTGPAAESSAGNPYVTRIVARFPTSKRDFSGRVFLEPFNTTSGPDRDAIWGVVAPLFQSQGDGWVGVSVRSQSPASLQAFDPIRYADVSIPVNDYVWDMLRQLGAVLKAGGDQSPLGDLRAEHLYLGGYSQSGVDTSTFAMAFHDTASERDGTAVFDGYLPAAHAAMRTPLQTGAVLISDFDVGRMEPPEVPMIDLETQHDVMGWAREVLPGIFYTSPGGASVRVPDRDAATKKYQLWEITGASHSSGGTADCGGTPSTFPGPPFVRAAAAALFRWAETGKAPKKAPRIEMATIDVVSKPSADEYGNALGGVRSPFVDVPLVTYQVQAGGIGLSCTFRGNETPLAPDVLADRYGDANSYMKEFTRRLDATIKAGRLLELDRDAILAATRAKAAQLLPTGTGS